MTALSTVTALPASSIAASTVTAAAAEFAFLLGELLVLFLVVASAVTLAARRLGVQRVRRFLGGGRTAGALKGIALGFATPFCTYSAIPVLAAMLDAGVRTSTWLGFLLAAPVLDPLIAVAMGVLFGPGAAVAYAVVTFVAILAAATIADATGLRQLRARVGARRVAHAESSPAHVVSAGQDAAAGQDACGVVDPLRGGPAWQGWRSETGQAARAAITLIRDMAVPLVVAVAFAVAIAGFVPEGLIVAVAGPGNPLAVPVAAVIGAPFYVSGEAFIPIAAALQDKGMSTGAVFALLVAGAGVNIPELGLLSRMVDLRVLVAIVASIFAVAILAGYVVPAVLSQPLV